MSRGYSLLVLFAIGLVIFATGSDVQAKIGNDRAQWHVSEQAASNSSDIATDGPNAPKATQELRNCAELDERSRESDICAQWKSAHAARDAANYALFGLFLSAIGTGLLVWTLAETRANSRRELRAYISVKIISTGIEIIPGKEVLFTQQAIAHNGGSTPAYDFVSFGHIIGAPDLFAEKHLTKPLPIQKEAL